MRMKGIVLALLLAVASTNACSPPGELRPLVANWEQFFRLDWQPGERKGRPAVQLLVEGLDNQGHVVWQRVEWLGSDVAPGTTSPFEVPVPQPAAAYRVSVFAFEWIQSGGP